MSSRILALFSMLAVAFAADARPPEELEPALRAAEADGAAIYQHDRAAARATDALLELDAFQRDARLDGWLTEARADDIVVTFYGHAAGEPPSALYRVAVSGSKATTPEVLEPAVPLTTPQAAQASARAIALDSGFVPCADRYNTVVLPRSDGSISVYLLAGMESNKVVPGGGHYRVDVDPTGSNIISMRPFSKTCRNLANDPKIVSWFLTHPLDPTPTEIHVFLNLLSRKLIYVGTDPNYLWKIERGTITRMQ